MSIEKHVANIIEASTSLMSSDDLVTMRMGEIYDSSVLIESALKWIPVEDELPKPDRLVRVRRKDGTIMLMSHSAFGWGYAFTLGDEGNPVIEWRALI